MDGDRGLAVTSVCLASQTPASWSHSSISGLMGLPGGLGPMAGTHIRRHIQGSQLEDFGPRLLNEEAHHFKVDVRKIRLQSSFAGHDAIRYPGKMHAG